MRPKVAIIGGGVAGLSAAYHLRKDADLTLFEKNGFPGGHARTIEFEENGKLLGIDTAFVVFNAKTYPQICGFFDELGVHVKEHNGGFTFFDIDEGIEYGTGELGLDQATLRSRFPAHFCDLVQEIQRFFQSAPRDFVRKQAEMPLKDYLRKNNYSEAFKQGYLVLLATAVWSIPPELIWEMPASTLIAFFMAHDQGGLGGQQVAWKTVGGGSVNYVRKVLATVNPTLRLGQKVTWVQEEGNGVVVKTADGASDRFDYAVIGAHADEAIEMLARPTASQELLRQIRYNDGRVVLHSDPSVMPKDRNRWLSWNYGKVRVNGATRSYVAYYMNRIHGLEAKKDYFVTLEYPREIDRSTVIFETVYRHPIITQAVRDMQKDLYAINNTGRIKFCGSYLHSKKIGPDLIGSHEAAFNSGMEAAKTVLKQVQEVR